MTKKKTQNLSFRVVVSHLTDIFPIRTAIFRFPDGARISVSCDNAYWEYLGYELRFTVPNLCFPLAAEHGESRWKELFFERFETEDVPPGYHYQVICWNYFERS